MKKTIIKCPNCAGQKLHIRYYKKYVQNYTIDDNKLYQLDKDSYRPMGVIWMICRDCSQNENIENSEWKASPEEIKIIENMLMDSFSIDITEHMT